MSCTLPLEMERYLPGGGFRARVTRAWRRWGGLDNIAAAAARRPPPAARRAPLKLGARKGAHAGGAVGAALVRGTQGGAVQGEHARLHAAAHRRRAPGAAAAPPAPTHGAGQGYEAADALACSGRAAERKTPRCDAAWRFA
jgi:hypothetical protein